MKQVNKISIAELEEMAEKMYGDIVKADVDIAKSILVVDMEMHSDGEAYMIKNGSLYENLEMFFGFGGEQTPQYEGVVRIPGDVERQERLKKHFIKQPGAQKYETDSQQVYFVVEPRWLPISESEPKVIGEMRFDPK